MLLPGFAPAFPRAGRLDGTVIPGDDAGQFNVGRHALCWVHAERLIHKLDVFRDRRRREKERIQTRLWRLYADLEAYRENPTRKRRSRLRRRFEALFTTRTGFTTLDRLLARLHANKIEWPPGEDEPTKYWLSTLPADTKRADLVDMAKRRWRVERDDQDLKQEVGLGHYEGRGWRGFHHHATLSIAA